jgi:isocitrate dehydrogenase (NAD+)
MLMRHIGFEDRAARLEMALDVCGSLEKKLVMTGRSDGATGDDFVAYIMETVKDSRLESRWKALQSR